MTLPLKGLLVVTLEQAVAAPMCSCRLADAGARVIKVERPEGDFARYYDKLAVPGSASAPRASGEGDSPPDRTLGESPSPQPSPRTRGEGADRASGGEGTERVAQTSIAR